MYMPIPSTGISFTAARLSAMGTHRDPVAHGGDYKRHKLKKKEETVTLPYRAKQLLSSHEVPTFLSAVL